MMRAIFLNIVRGETESNDCLTSRSSNLILCKLGVDDREGSLRLSPRLSLFYSLNSTQTDED